MRKRGQGRAVPSASSPEPRSKESPPLGSCVCALIDDLFWLPLAFFGGSESTFSSSNISFVLAHFVHFKTMSRSVNLGVLGLKAFTGLWALITFSVAAALQSEFFGLSDSVGTIIAAGVLTMLWVIASYVPIVYLEGIS